MSGRGIRPGESKKEGRTHFIDKKLQLDDGRSALMLAVTLHSCSAESVGSVKVHTSLNTLESLSNGLNTKYDYCI